MVMIGIHTPSSLQHWEVEGFTEWNRIPRASVKLKPYTLNFEPQYLTHSGRELSAGQSPNRFTVFRASELTPLPSPAKVLGVLGESFWGVGVASWQAHHAVCSSWVVEDVVKD